MTKQERHRAIKLIIVSKEVRTQEELAAELHKRGVRVTQATLSRDLAELGVSRLHTENGLKYVIAQNGSQAAMRNLAGFEILRVESNDTMVVIKTLAGHAHAVGAYLDGVDNKDILGTIAGDDTILVIPSAQSKTKTVQKYIQQLLA